jgi:hypothetical protein
LFVKKNSSFSKLVFVWSPFTDIGHLHGCTRSVIAYYTHQTPVYCTLPGVLVLHSTKLVQTHGL